MVSTPDNSTGQSQPEYTQLRLPLPSNLRVINPEEKLLGGTFRFEELPHSTFRTLTNGECQMIIDCVLDPASTQRLAALGSIPVLAELGPIAFGKYNDTEKQRVFSAERFLQLIDDKLVHPIAVFAADRIRGTDGWSFIGESITGIISERWTDFDDKIKLETEYRLFITSLAAYIREYLRDHEGLYDYIAGRTLKELSHPDPDFKIWPKNIHS